MTEDWAADVKKFVPDADDAVIAAIVRYCGIALRNRDSSLVSFTDPAETGRVRENFLKKKLGLTDADEVLDKAIAAVGERMKGSNFKNRVTVYYLLLDHLGLLHLFGGAKAAAASGSAAALAGAGAAAIGAAGFAAQPEASAPQPEPAAWTAPQPAAGLHGSTAAAGKSGKNWWPWLLLGLLALLLLWWLFGRGPSGEAMTEQTPPAAEAPAPAPAAPGFGDLAAAPAEGAAVVPTGAGVTAETRDGKPVVKVYFDTGKADVAPAFTDAAGGLKTYLDGHAGTSLAVSGFNDKTGNAAFNAELSKNRAQAVKAALVAAGVPDASVELVKPAETTDAASVNAEARRVEVVVR